MSKLIPLSNINIDNFIELLRDSELIIYENIQGSKIFFQYDGKEIILKARNINTDPINKIDLALQKYYQSAWNYLESLDERVKKLLPKNWWFCCQYFYDQQPSHIKYDRLPKNNLILTSIIKNGTFTFEYDELVEYANLLEIECQPVLFKGKLTEKQIELITYFLNTSQEDLEHIFGENNFAYFFYKILNPQLNNSLLMSDGNFQENLEKLIIKIDNDEISFSILNPMYKQNQNEKSEHVDNYTILLVEFLEFLQLANLDKVALKSVTSDDLYLELMSLLFNEYCKSREEKIMNFEFTIPPFFYEDKFKVNLDMINNAQTKNWLEKSVKLQYFFKIILSSFRHRKKKPIGIFTEATLKIFNDAVDLIQATIDKILKVERDLALSSDKLLNFNDFFKIKYPVDGEGNVYPDLYKELGGEEEINNKKKKLITKKK